MSIQNTASLVVSAHREGRDEAGAIIEGVLSKMIAQEDSTYRAAQSDKALSETGRDGIVQCALARESALKSALCAIQVALRDKE